MHTSQSIAPRSLSNVGASSLFRATGDGRPQVIDAAGRNVTPRALLPLLRAATSVSSTARPANLAASNLAVSNLSLVSDGAINVGDEAGDILTWDWEEEESHQLADQNENIAMRPTVRYSIETESPQQNMMSPAKVDEIADPEAAIDKIVPQRVMRLTQKRALRKHWVDDVASRSTQVIAPAVRSRGSQATQPTASSVSVQVTNYDIADGMRRDCLEVISHNVSRDEFNQAAVNAVLVAALGRPGSLIDADAAVRIAPLVVLQTTEIELARRGGVRGRRRAGDATASAATSMGRSGQRLAAAGGASESQKVGEATSTAHVTRALSGGTLAVASPPLSDSTRRILASKQLCSRLAFMERVVLAAPNSTSVTVCRRFARVTPTDPGHVVVCATSNMEAATESKSISLQTGLVDVERGLLTPLATTTTGVTKVWPNASWCGDTQPLSATLSHLISFTRIGEGGVTSMAWNVAETDILAVGYDVDIKRDVDAAAASRPASCATQRGCCSTVLLWSLRSPGGPIGTLRVPHSGVSVTAIAFSSLQPTLLAAGLANGIICVFDMRTALHGNVVTPFTQSQRLLQGAHTEAVWQLAWTTKSTTCDEVLTSVSTDGRVTEWSLKGDGGLVPTPLMNLRRPRSAAARSSNVLGATCSEGLLPRMTGGLCIAFSPVDSTQYVVGTLDGDIHRCSTTYTEMAIASFPRAHAGSINRIATSPFLPSVIASASSDWTVAVRDITAPTSQPPLVLSATGVRDAVLDVAWSPTVPTMLASATGDGRLHLWDVTCPAAPIAQHIARCNETSSSESVTASTECPPNRELPPRRLTSILFSPSGTAIVVGDAYGCVDVFVLCGIDSVLATHEDAAMVMAELCHVAQATSIAPASGKRAPYEHCGSLPPCTAAIVTAALAGEADASRYRRRISELVTVLNNLVVTPRPASGSTADVVV